jgi:hypothetical protein
LDYSKKQGHLIAETRFQHFTSLLSQFLF